MNVSVIIPTLNRQDQLAHTLTSICNHSFDKKHEIILVDNGSVDNTANLVARLNQNGNRKIRYVLEPRLGLHFARHSGAKISSGDLLIFTDDDATFDPNWVRAYVDAFESHPEMVAAGGPVRPVWSAPRPSWLAEFMGNDKTFGILSLMEPYEDFRLSTDGFFWGVNMAIRRQALFDVGGFNPDSFGDTWLGDGESGLNNKIWERGWLVGYVPDAVVYHHIPASRMTPQYLRHRMANQGACDVYTRYHKAMPSSAQLFKSAAGIFRRNYKLWIASVKHLNKTDRRSLDIQIRAAQTFSQFKYTLRLMARPHMRELVTKTDWLHE